MHADLFDRFFEDVPSGSDSEDSLDELSEPDVEAERMDVAFLDEVTSDGWESEDDLPLSVIQQQEKSKTTVWSYSSRNVLRNMKVFAEETGPNIPDHLETPTDIFLQIFPDDLINHITFQTNLFALQKSGGSTTYVPTTSEDIKVFFAINLLMGIKNYPVIAITGLRCLS